MEEHRPVRAAVDGIAGDGDAEPIGGMDPDLVGPAGFGREEDHRPAVADRDPAPAGQRGPAALVRDHPPAFGLARNLGERHVDHAFLDLRHPVEDRQIGLGHLLRLEGALEALVGLGVAGEEKAARRVAVEAVDGEGRALEAEAEMLEIILEALGRPRSRMDGETGRLVDDDRLAVDEQHIFIPHGLFLSSRGPPCHACCGRATFAAL